MQMKPYKSSPQDLVEAVRVIASWFDEQAAESNVQYSANYWNHLIRARALDEAADVLEKQKKILMHVFAEKSGAYFVCGESGDKDTMGLPEKIFVCPRYGLEGMAVYTKTQDYNAPEW
jgi:hypothetical protein